MNCPRSTPVWAAAAALALMSPLAADDKQVDLKVGDKAPAFLEHDDTGNIWNAADYIGKKIIVVYFFPAAMTGG